MRRLPLRARLVAGFLAAMTVLLVVAGAVIYWRVHYALDRALDTDLTRATSTIGPLVDDRGQVTSPSTAAATGALWQVLDRDGSVLDSGLGAPRDALVAPSRLGGAGDSTSTTDIGDLLSVSPAPYRVSVSGIDGARLHLVVAVRRDHRDEALRELLLQLGLAGVGTLVVAALVGDLLARAALRPVERYRLRAHEIAAGGSGLRLDVPSDRDDEVTRLGTTLNEMLTTLERSLARERRFVDDASHEMRTPLTLLTSRIQLALRRDRTADQHEAVLEELAVDVARLTDLTDHLLDLGTACATGARTATADVGEVVTALVARRRGSRPGDVGDLLLDVTSGSASVALAPLSVDRLVTNLVDNAFLHGRPPVTVTVGTGRDLVWVQVQDAGSGMPPDLLERATERFTRSPQARSRPGAGLGLALAAQVVTDAGGELRLCHGGTHVTRGRPADRPCDHAATMTVMVLLPRGGVRG